MGRRRSRIQKGGVSYIQKGGVSYIQKGGGGFVQEFQERIQIVAGPWANQQAKKIAAVGGGGPITQKKPLYPRMMGGGVSLRDQPWVPLESTNAKVLYGTQMPGGGGGGLRNKFLKVLACRPTHAFTKRGAP